MSKRSPRKKKKEEKDKVAKVHRITRRHTAEMRLAHYAKRLDQIYSKLDMAHMVPQVVQKMRREYADNPHELYLKVCHKWGVTPEERYDQYLLVYGKKTHKKFKPQEETDKEREDSIERKEDNKIPEKAFAFDVKKDSRARSPEIVTQSPRRAKAIERMYQPKYYQKRTSPRRDYYEERKSPSPSPRLSPRKKIEYVNVYPGDICETMVLTNSTTNQETGFWISARVLAINTDKETLDLEVLEPQKYGLSQLAKDVPNRYVRAPAKMW